MDSELFTYSTVRPSGFSAKLSHFNHLFRRQFGINVALSNWPEIFCSFFPVFRVLKTCASVKMVRVAARRVVAFVKHPKTIWNLAVMNGVRNPVSHSRLSVYTYLTITALTSPKRPLPTWAKFRGVFRNGAVFIDALPKSSESSGIQLERVFKNWDFLRKGNLVIHIVLSGSGALQSHPACASYHPSDNATQG